MSEPTKPLSADPSRENPEEAQTEPTFTTNPPPSLLLPAYQPQPEETPVSSSGTAEDSDPPQDEPIVPAKRGPAQPVKKAPEPGTGPRRYSPLASFFIVAGILLFFPAILWIPQIISDRNDRQAVETELDSTSIVWANYSEEIRGRVVDGVLEKNCQTLQKVFNSVVEENKAELASTSQLSADILLYLNDKLTEYGCYKDNPVLPPSSTPLPASPK